MIANPNLVYGTIVISPSSKILVVQGRYTGKWSFPKGHSYPNELELDCALRETYEETGIQLSDMYQRTLHLATGDYFVYPYPCEEECIPNDKSEIQDIRWVSLDQLRTMRVNVDINTFLRKHTNSFGIKKQFPSPIKVYPKED